MKDYKSRTGEEEEDILEAGTGTEGGAEITLEMVIEITETAIAITIKADQVESMVTTKS